jgi:predicted RNA-binding Zn ribbon-like protein
MDFGSYNDCGVRIAVELVNTGVASPEALRELLERVEISAVGPINDQDLAETLALRPRLRSIWEAPDEHVAAAIINGLLLETRALPQLTDHDGEPWHLHFTPPGAPLAQRIAAETAMALAGVLHNDGFDRMRVCADTSCGYVFVDASRNHSRRFCDPDTCGNRASVAAYRARQRALATTS